MHQAIFRTNPINYEGYSFLDTEAITSSLLAQLRYNRYGHSPSAEHLCTQPEVVQKTLQRCVGKLILHESEQASDDRMLYTLAEVD